MTNDDLTDAERKMQFLYALRSKGMTDKRVLSAMEAVDRGPFIKGLFSQRAYEAVSYTHLTLPTSDLV